MALWGCGGGSGGGASSTRIYRYGAVNNGVMETLARSMGAGGFSRGQRVGAGDVVALDGDSVSSAQIASDTEIDRILAAGASVLLLDAKAEHKTAMRGATRAGAAIGGESEAILYTPFQYAGGRRGVYMLELVAGELETATKETMQSETGIVQGAISKKTVRRKFREETKSLYASRVNALTTSPWTDPYASSVPPEVSWMSVPYEVVDSADDAALNGQSISESIQFVFRGFSSPPEGNGPGANTIYVEHYGEIVNGALKVPPKFEDPGGDHPQLFQIEYGWFQTSASVTVTPDRSNPSGQAVLPGKTNTTVSGNSYQSSYDYFVSYYDASGNVQSWQPTWKFPDPPQATPSWSLQTQNGDPQFSYFQTDPFNTSLASPDYFDFYDKKKNNFKVIPDASLHQLNMWGAGEFLTSSAVDGPVRFNVKVGRDFTKIQIRFKFPVFTPPSEGGAVVVSEEGNLPVVLDLAQCKPASP